MISGHDIEDLIAHWQQEAKVARESQRTDDYAQLCEKTVDGLRELSKWRRLEVLQEWIDQSE